MTDAVDALSDIVGKLHYAIQLARIATPQLTHREQSRMTNIVEKVRFACCALSLGARAPAGLSAQKAASNAMEVVVGGGPFAGTYTPSGVPEHRRDVNTIPVAGAA